MRKSYLVFLPFICGMQVFLLPLPAAAYEYIYHTNAPDVIVDPSVLNDGSSQNREATLPGEASNETAPSAPVAPVERVPARPELKKPFFADVPLTPPAQKSTSHPKQFPPPLPKQLPPPVVQQQMPSLEPAPAPVKEKRLAAPLFTAPVSASPPPPATPPAAKPAGAVEWQPDKTPDASLTPEEKKQVVPAISSAADTANTDIAKTDTSKKTETQKATEAPAIVPVPALTPAETAPIVGGPVDLSLNFDTTASQLSPQAQGDLDGILKQLQDKPDMRLQIRGYAKGDDSDQGSARRIALSRALSVRSYLMDKGIKPVRLDVRALGSATDRMPIDRVDLVLVK